MPELPFPFGGLSDDQAAGRQVPGTTSSATNVRGIDPATGRLRGGQRAGLTKVNTEPLVADGTPVQELAQTMRPVDHLEFTTLADPDAGNSQLSAEGSLALQFNSLTGWTEFGAGQLGDLFTISDGRASGTFELVALGQEPDSPDTIPVFGTPLATAETNLRAIGDTIQRSNLEVGYTIDDDITSFSGTLRLYNQRGNGTAGNVPITVDREDIAGNWTATGFTGGEDGTRNTLLTDWDRRPPGASETVAATRDVDNNVWTVSTNGVAQRFNPDGEVLATINVPTGGGWFLAPVIAEDAERNVYFATNQEGSALDVDQTVDPDSRVYKFRQVAPTDEDELPTYEQEWRYDLDRGRIMDMRESVGVLYIVFLGELVARESATRIDAYAPLTSTAPIRVTTRDLFFRPRGMEVLPNGNIALASPKDTTNASARQPRPEYTLPIPEEEGQSDIWTPWDLRNYRERLWFWVRAEDALDAGGATPDNGEEIVTWPDHRQSPPSNRARPLDNTDRPLVKNERDGPEYDTDAFGHMPGVRFTDTYDASGLTGECLVTAPNVGSTGKTTTADIVSDQFGPFPSWSDSLYAVFFIIRLDSEDMDSGAQARVLFSQRAAGDELTSPTMTSQAFLTGSNGGVFAAGGFDPPTGGEVWYIPGAYHGYDTPPGTPGSLVAGTGDHPDADTSPNRNTESVAATPERIAIVSIIKGQPASSTQQRSVVRVNGRQVDAFAHTQDLSNGFRFALGCRRVDDAENTSQDCFSPTRTNIFATIDSFKGQIGEMITILGDSTDDSSPHDVPVSCPIGGDGAGGRRETGYPNSGSAPHLAAHENVRELKFSLASEVELVEGYLAAKYGVPNVLPYEPATLNDDLDASITKMYSSHPFGGVGWFPPGPSRRTDEYFHLYNFAPKIVMLSPGLDVLDSAWGAGLGRAVGDDGDGQLISLASGNDVRFNGHSYSAHLGDQGEMRRLAVAGGQFSDRKCARGFVSLIDTPPDGDTLTLSDGNLVVVFEFTSGAVSGTNTLVSTAGLANTQFKPTLRQLVERLKTAIDASGLEIDTFHASGNIDLTAQNLWLVQRTAGFAGNVTIEISSSTMYLRVEGFAGGSDPANDWIFNEVGTSSAALQNAWDGVPIPVNTDEDGNFYYGNRTISGTRDIIGRNGDTGVPFLRHAFDVNEEPRAVLPLLDPPDYREEDLEAAESLYVITERASTDVASTVYRLRTATVVESVLNGQFSSREPVYLGVSDGSIVRFSRAGTPAVVTGGSEVLTAGSPYIQSAVLFGDIFFTDGVSAYVYKVEDDEVVPFKATSAGAPPRRFRLVASWRGRLVIARVPGDDFNWYMSKQGDPYNWDLSPVVLNAAQAVTGSGRTEQLLGPGDNADVINALIPWSDDLLIYGGDRSVQRLTGDPMSGGQIDLMTEATGIAWGSPWTRSPSGVLYFFGSRGGVWAMTPSGQIERLTTYTIERRMRDLQLDANKLRLVWNYEDEGLHVIPIRYDLTATAIPKSWFLDVKHGAWWEDEWSDSSVTPTAALLVDGDDPRDRKVFLGCRDGRVRFMDQLASTDDGFRIQSEVLIGPLMPEPGELETRFDGLNGVVAAGYGPTAFEVFTGDTPESLTKVGGGRFLPGRNALSSVRWTGPSAWVKLRSGDQTRWALESLMLRAYPAGRKRIR